MVPRWRVYGDFLRAVFSASRAQHVSDLQSKFTRPHHMWNMADIQSPTAEIRRGKKKRKPQDENIYGLPYYIGRPYIIHLHITVSWGKMTIHSLSIRLSVNSYKFSKVNQLYTMIDKSRGS